MVLTKKPSECFVKFTKAQYLAHQIIHIVYIYIYAPEMIQIASSGFSVIHLAAWPFFTLPQQVTNLHPTPSPLLEALSATTHPFSVLSSFPEIQSHAV